jgi:general secretion pathway protein K
MLRDFFNTVHKGINPYILANNKGGVALILVMWVMVVLIAIVGEFSSAMRTELKITRNFKEEEQSYQAALRGIELAKMEILSAKAPYYVYRNEEDMLVFGQEDESPVREGESGNSFYSYTISDENGKININTATRQQLKYVIQNTGVDITEVDTIVDSILDWRDKNDLHMLNGAEEDYYKSLEKPYSCKDGPFDIIEELLLVKGVTPSIFYGSQDQEGEDEYSGLVQYFSPWSSRKININTAPREVLEAVLGIQASENIMNHRETGAILTPMSGGSVTSSVFSVISTGSSLDETIKRTVKATIRRISDRIEVIYWNDNYIG